MMDGGFQTQAEAPQDMGIARLVLLTEARRARNLRQSKRAAEVEARLRAVTHAILKEGRRDA